MTEITAGTGPDEVLPVKRPPKPASDTIVDAILSLYEFALDTGGELFLLPGGQLRDVPYVPRSFLTGDVRNLVHKMWRKSAKRWNAWVTQLTDAERKELKVQTASKVPAADTVSGIAQHLEALGTEDGREDGRLVTAALRSVQVNGGLVIDLGDKTGEVAYVTADGWKVTDPRDLPFDPPVFRRRMGYLPLPQPVRGGDLGRLREILRITGAGYDSNWNLITGWLAAAFFAEVSRPGLWGTGPAGCGKTTAACAVARIIDGTEWLNGRLDKNDERNNIIRAVKSYVVSMDNMRAVSGDTSDWLCTLVTGREDMYRKMRSNFDDISVAYKRTFVATGLSLPYGLGADALDRIIELPFSQIPEAKRASDERLKAELDAAWPELLGAVLDHVAAVLAQLPLLPVDGYKNLGRMSGYARILAGHDLAYGSGGLACLNAYQESVAQIREDRAEAEPVAEALRKLLAPVRCGKCGACQPRTAAGQPVYYTAPADLEACTAPLLPSWCRCPGCASGNPGQHQRITWDGTAAQLLVALSSHRVYTDAPPVIDGKEQKNWWPGNARALGHKLTELDGVLRSGGIIVSRRVLKGINRVRLEQWPG